MSRRNRRLRQTRRRKRRQRGKAPRITVPPGFDRRILRRVPRRHRLDTAQEAWLAFLLGRNPNTAARNYALKELLHEERVVQMSQLTAEQYKKFRRL